MSEKDAFTQLEQRARDLESELCPLKNPYRAVDENNPDAVLLTSLDGDIVSANPAACALFKMTEKELVNGGCLAVADPSDPILPGIPGQPSSAGGYRAEITLKKKDGTIFPAEIFSSVFFDAEPKAMTSLIIRDLTQRTSRRHAREERQTLMMRFVEHAPVPLAMFDRDMRYLAASPRWTGSHPHLFGGSHRSQAYRGYAAR